MIRAAGVLPWLARRFLTSKSSDGFVSLIAWVSVAGVTIGVLALVIVTSVINGFEGELSRVITGMNGDVIFYSRGEPISSPQVLERKLRQVVPEIDQIAPSFIAELMIAGPAGVSGAALEGVEFTRVGRVTRLTERVIQGDLPIGEAQVALGSSLAEKIGAKVGSTVRVIVPFTEGDSESGELGPPKVSEARVAGIVRMGMHDYDSRFAYARADWVQGVLGQPDRYTAFKIKLKPGADSWRAAERLSDQFGYPFRAKNWAQLNKNLLYAIELEKVVIAIILTIIVLVAAFNVVSTLMMMIHDKTRQIAILKAVGFRPFQGFMLFCILGLGMGAVGTAMGVGLGLAGSWVLGNSRFIELPADVYYISFLPVHIRWTEVGWIAGVSILISFLATIYPAWKVSTRPPLEGIRYE